MVQRSIASVLVVDDSATMRSILRDMVTRLGFRNVDDAPDGQAALAKIQARGYSLIISDWHMEPMNGLDLLRAVQRIRTPGSNRFIFSTTERSWGSQTTARLDGADAFIVKPFTLEALKAKIEAVLAH
jgi:two-component system chemotaxis response regulator CheY